MEQMIVTTALMQPPQMMSDFPGVLASPLPFGVMMPKGESVLLGSFGDLHGSGAQTCCSFESRLLVLLVFSFSFVELMG